MRAPREPQRKPESKPECEPVAGNLHSFADLPFPVSGLDAGRYRALTIRAVSDPADPFDGATAFLNPAPASERSTEGAELASSVGPAVAESAAEVDPLVGQVLAGRYRIDRLLGTGGMGAVYRAEHVHMRKVMALKVLHREMTVMPEIVARFEREAVAAARIEHPNVATATDFGRLEDGAFYLVLEFVEGKSLSQALEEVGTFPPLRAVHVARQIAEALAAAHGAGVVHRDLKPDNVMLVEREGDRDFAKVLDFGIAKVQHGDDVADAAEPVLTQAGSVFGTPSYMSPEQAKGDAVDARSDLYTLGMILYELLSGQTAFVANELIAILTKTLTEEAPPLPESVPLPLRELVMKLLRKEPGERIQTAEELARELGSLELSLSAGASSTAAAVSALPESEAPVVASLAKRAANAQGRALAVLGEARVRLTELGRRRVALGGREVPLWCIAAPAVVLGMTLTFVVAAPGSEQEAKAAPGLAAEAKRLATAVFDPALAALLQKAQGGDREALAELRKRADKDGGAQEWFALGRGYAEIRHFSASAEAYGRALTADASLASNPRLLADLETAAEDRDGYEKALDVALAHLGERGADLVYGVYKSNSGAAGMTAVVAYAKKLTQKDEFEKNASEALKVALALEKARVCSDYKALLPLAVEHADQRSERKLKSLNATRGCGFLGVLDCYPCLRSGSELKEAIEAAGKRQAPRSSTEKSSEKPAKKATADGK